ncbi:hypothetical protein OIE71_04690 [Streptomyces sp. NBC_01725]|uniref:hypothetical protein n=1 Tax=Streptomyces sp. NBC_01725 TaxID=2975923 RepID=UPI002E2CFF49|nr:hypothetical protein [Streptomyces sp. NBC_01725]
MSVDPAGRTLVEEWLTDEHQPVPMPDDHRLYRPAAIPLALLNAHTAMCDVPPVLRGPNWRPRH